MLRRVAGLPRGPAHRYGRHVHGRLVLLLRGQEREKQEAGWRRLRLQQGTRRTSPRSTWARHSSRMSGSNTSTYSLKLLKRAGTRRSGTALRGLRSSQ